MSNSAAVVRSGCRRCTRSNSGSAVEPGYTSSAVGACVARGFRYAWAYSKPWYRSALEASIKQSLGTSARTLIAGERVTVTLAGTAPDALAQWLTQARVNARALPGEARLYRNSAGLWEGTLVLTLPPR